ncbi:hypothetical protein JYU34_022734, partial [Plutella xylostella]
SPPRHPTPSNMITHLIPDTLRAAARPSSPYNAYHNENQCELLGMISRGRYTSSPRIKKRNRANKRGRRLIH